MFRRSDDLMSGAEIIARYSSADLPAITITISYPYTGSDTTIAVPVWATIASPKMWGGAGGASNIAAATRGGAGAFVGFSISVTGGENLVGKVGQGGYSTSSVGGARTYGGGGTANPTGGFYTGAGAGFSALYRGSTLLGLAAGGGGSGTDGTAGSGGASTGENATLSQGGLGGTQLAGGSVGGAALLGGNSTQTYSGGGGSGYFGGGAGVAGGGGGGGGSSFIDPSAANPVTTSGSGFTPGNNTDPSYIAGIGVGGLGTANGLTTAIGGNGLLVITFRSF